jgi:hypothetical protein
MSRISKDQFDGQGILLNGFDYDKQAWVADGKYVRCGHPETMNCKCHGKAHAGESVSLSIETMDLELIDWSERFPQESSFQIAVRQSTVCLCGQQKNIGDKSCGQACRAGVRA